MTSHVTPFRDVAAAVAALAALALVAPTASAQSVTQAVDGAGATAGAVARELPAPATPLPALSGEARPASGAAPKAEAGATFTFRKLAVTGLTALSPAQVEALAAAQVGRAMGENELAALLQALRVQLDDAGLLQALIGVPSIDLAQGVVTVPVLEPHLGRITVTQGADAPISEARVRGLLAWFKMGEGSLMNIDALDRVMFALNDMPGVQAKAKLVPAGDEGVYNLQIVTSARRAWDASVNADNMGLAPVGRLRMGGTARLNNPLGLGDNLDVQGLLSDTAGVKLARVGYELPVAYTPARLAVAASRLSYKLGGQFDALGAHGDANLLEANLSYPLIRSRNRTLLARVGIDSKTFKDQIDQTGDDSERKLRGAHASLNWESRDAWGGGGFWGLGGTFRTGRLSYPASLSNLDGRVEAGSFHKFEGQASRLQTLAGPLSVFVAASVQQASRTLDPAEKVGLGGSKGVRAYAASEAPADDARILNTELRWWLDPHWTVFALTDWAHGRLDHGVSGNSVTLRGSGLGVAASFPDWVNVRATLAWRHSGAGLADPGHDLPRLAVQLQHAF